jgi:hypothetical protein
VEQGLESELIEKRNPQWKDLSEGWYRAEEFEFALRTLDSPVKPWNDKRESGE